jgi:peptidoglycan/LPS O-acetylase OafA/YrhL
LLYVVAALLPQVDPVIGALIALAASIGLAWAMWLLVEKPCARLRRRLTD